MDWNAVLSIAAVCLVVGLWTVVIVRQAGAACLPQNGDGNGDRYALL